MNESPDKVASLIERMKARQAAWQASKAKRGNERMLGVFVTVLAVGAIIVMLYLAFR